MLYFETSFLIPMFISEQTSEKVETFLLSLSPDQDLAVSQWTRVEFASVLSRLVRMGQLQKSVALECSGQFERLLERSFRVIVPTAMDFEQCWNFLIRFDNNLRAGDALHLAIAAARSVEQFYTLDRGVSEAGELLKIPVSQGIA